MINYAIKTFVKKVAMHHHYIIPGTRLYPSWVHLDTKAAPMKVSNEKFITLTLSRSDTTAYQGRMTSGAARSDQEDDKSSV